jgi:uncharacterized RDD family membrane protein YckC
MTTPDGTDDPNRPNDAPDPAGAGSTPGGPPPQYGQYGAPQDNTYGRSPYSAAPAGGQLASWISRVGGYLIDAIIVAVPSGVIGLLTGSRAVYDVLAFIGFLILGYLNGAQGQTPGKRVVGLRLVREQDGQLLGGGMGIVRQICHILDSLACLIGWFWPLWDSKRQTFADKIASTVVLQG